MKYKSIFAALAAGCILFQTGCYPGDASPADSSTSSSDSSAPSEAAAVQSDNEKLHIQITEEQIRAASHSSAQTGVTGTVHPWDNDALQTLFGDEIESERRLSAQPVDARNYHIYDLHDGGILNCSDGHINYSKTKRTDTIYSVYFDDFVEYLTPSLLADRFPNPELEDFPVADAKEIVQQYIDTLEIPVAGEPTILALDLDSITALREEAIAQTGDAEFYPAWTKEDEAYRFSYRLGTEEMPLLSYPLIGGDDKANYFDAYLSVIVSRSGVLFMDCKGALDLDTSAASAQTVCSANEALSAVKDNIERTVVTKDTTLTNLYFGYAMKYVDDFHFELTPMYFVGSYAMSNTTLADGTRTAIPISSPHFISAETGKELS